MDNLPICLIASANGEAVKLIKSAVSDTCTPFVYQSIDDLLTIYPSISPKAKLVFFDMDMTAPDEAIETLEELRRISHIPEMIVFTSDMNNLKLCRRAMKIGTFDYMLMPLSKDRIAMATRNALSQSDAVQKLTGFVTDKFDMSFMKRAEILHEIIEKRRVEGKFLTPEELHALMPSPDDERRFQLNFKNILESASIQTTADPIQILIVEDEPAIQYEMTDLLDSYGFTVYNATDAKTAVDIARRHPTIQLFCLDIGLPDKSGALLLPELKKMLPNAEAIMITAYQSVDLMVKSFQNLARDYIIKPYDDDELVAIISKALQHRNLTLAIHQAQDSALVDRIIDSTKRTRLLQDLGEKRLLSHKALYMEDVYVFFPDLRGSGLPENQKITKKQIEDGLMLLVDSLAKTITRA